MEVIFQLVKWLVIVLYVHNGNTSAQAAERGGRLLYYALPDKRPLKKALGFIEDTYLNFTELTDKYGFPTETHDVTTEDGYILAVFRILPKCEGQKRGYPVVMMHGIYDTADEWILTGPDAGLGYILAKNCYDVWAANHRGNYYSRRHVSLNPNKDIAFWDFTFDEHGYYDVPAIVDYVLQVTQQPKVNYIGHSQGTTDFFVMGSLRPEYNNKIQLSCHIAPVAYMGNVGNPFLKLVASLSGPLKNVLDDLGFRELFAKHQLIHFVTEFLCQYAPDQICGTAYSLATGYKQGSISSRNLAIAFGHLFAGISTKDLVHFGQLVTSGRFQRYDYGRKKNMQRYGSPIPPEYDLSKVTSSVVLISASNDQLSTPQDVEILVSKLPNLVENYLVPNPYWSHNDQIFGNEAPKLVFAKIVQYLNSFN
ncbi:alpha/beta-hydrolase lipase region domain-containing protein [Phthorimaea operculella]|nr:alpha/beta-hydrolase lipase region domain-containing protein [Phthorimaea operculella]